MTAPRYVLALEEARRGMDQQVADLSGVRDRAATVLGIGGLSASFMGGFAWREDASPSRWIWAAVPAFVLVAVLYVIILWPRRFPVTEKPVELVRWEETEGATVDGMNRNLALYMGRMYDNNRATLNLLMRLYCGAVAAVLVEITALFSTFGADDARRQAAEPSSSAATGAGPDVAGSWATRGEERRPATSAGPVPRGKR